MAHDGTKEKKPKPTPEVKFTVPPLRELEARLPLLPLKFNMAREALVEEITRKKSFS